VPTLLLDGWCDQDPPQRGPVTHCRNLEIHVSGLRHPQLPELHLPRRPNLFRRDSRLRGQPRSFFRA
jgi:hypothetical protein